MSKFKQRFGGKLLYAAIAAVFLVLAAIYAGYTRIAGSTVPIMDFWHWIRVYGEDLLHGTISFRDFFHADPGQHIRPLSMALQFYVLRAFKFNVSSLVIGGMLLRILLAAGVVVVFLRCNRKQIVAHPVFACFAAMGIAMSVLNYNQWEMTMEPFSLSNACRVLLYYVSFYLVDRFLRGMDTRSFKKNVWMGFGIGLLCCFLTIFVGAAYFTGHLPAIGLTMLFFLFARGNGKKEYWIPAGCWCAVAFLGACVYYGIFSAGAASVSGAHSADSLIFLCKCLVLFWGSLFYPQFLMESRGYLPVWILGMLFLIFSVCILVCYLIRACREPDMQHSMIPVMCYFYALVISVVIAMGRTDRYGMWTMTSSRYVIESSIGLTGVLWMLFSVFVQGRTKWKILVGRASAILMLVLLLYSARAEILNAPNRKAYNDRIRQMMMNPEEFSDEELAFAQGSPDDVRYCIDFFRENNLSIYAE